ICRVEDKFNSLVAFLRQHKHEKQLVFFSILLTYFLSINQKCPLEQMAPVSDVVDVLPKVKALADQAMFDRGMRAFISTVQAYAKRVQPHLQDLNFVALARGFALLRMPRMPELKGKNFPDFKKTTIDTDNIRYKDKQREKLRQKLLIELKERRGESRCSQETTIRTKPGPTRRTGRTGSDMDDEYMKELLEDTHLLNRLKGQISEEDFEKQVTGQTPAGPTQLSRTHETHLHFYIKFDKFIADGGGGEDPQVFEEVRG
ncbi:unnamed protein product, partial [Coregonus sp. 'balchen']